MNIDASIGRRSLLVLIGLLFVPGLTLAASDDATLTVGRTVDGGVICGGIELIFSGYITGAIGSYSPTGLTGGKAVVMAYDLSGCMSGARLTVAGFSSNPGIHWLSSITCNGITNPLASATFNYSADQGYAYWSWPQRFGFTDLPVGSNVSCTLIHN